MRPLAQQARMMKAACAVHMRKIRVPGIAIPRPSRKLLGEFDCSDVTLEY